MYTNSGTYSQIGNNDVKTELKFHPIDNKQHSHTNQATSHKTHHQSAKASFIKRFNPFSKSKSQTINCNSDCVNQSESLNDKEYTSVKVLKQFWNEQIKTAKSTEHLNRRSATIKFFSQSNDSINDLKCNRVEKAQTLDARRIPLDEFNKFKDAAFIRNKKNRLKYFTGNVVGVTKFSRPDSFTLNDNHFPQISATGGKIHWAKREDIFTKRPHQQKEEEKDDNDDEDDKMSVKSTTKTSDGKKANNLTKKDSISSSAGSLNSSVSNTNSASRKVSFKTSSASTAGSYMSRKIASTSSGTKVAQIAQRFNQMIQQDATILDEVKKRGALVLHRSGGCVYKIKEEKVENKATLSLRKSLNDDTAASDDAASLPSIVGNKNSTRKKSSLKKRPSIRILVESPRKDGKGGNVLSKKQLYETNIVNKETIVLKPKVPDKSERVLAKTKELKIKKLNEIKKTETKSSLPVDNEDDDKVETCEPQKHSPAKDSKKNNFQKIYDKISFRPTFLYGKKVSKLETTPEVVAAVKPATENVHRDDISKDTNEDELEFQPIDLNLNVYFNNENLSATPKEATRDEDGNVNSQGSDDDITQADDKPDQSALDMKPNESFLFRSQFGGSGGAGKLDSFIRDMLCDDEDASENIDSETMENVNANSIKCNSDLENSYEVISKGVVLTNGCGERIDIDVNGNDGVVVVVVNAVTASAVEEAEENIYQSLCEVKGETESVKSYESFENYDEIAQNILDNKINLSDLLKGSEDDYIFPEKAPEPPPPRRNTIPRISSPILTSSTSNLVQPELQVPKLNKLNYELQKSDSCTSTTYEKIKYDQLPLLTQLQKLPLPPRYEDHQLPCDENIYDTIKNGDNRSLNVTYDKLPDKKKTITITDDTESFHIRDECENPYKNSKNDTMSIISNCYESISLKQNYSTINQILRHAISTSTLTSEHRINSIYGTMVGQSLTPPSDRSASDSNSDEWIDLSDEENDLENVTDNRFIV